MIDLTQLQLTAQLVDNMEIAIRELEKSYNNTNSERFNLSKKEIMDIQNKISKLIA